MAPAIVSASMGWNQPLKDITSPKTGFSWAIADDATAAIAVDRAADFNIRAIRIAMLLVPLAEQDEISSILIALHLVAAPALPVPLGPPKRLAAQNEMLISFAR